MVGLLLQNFKSTDLNQIKKVSLLDRIESKYVLHDKDLETFISALPLHLQVLNINSEKLCAYKTTYFDTLNHDMYLDHHRGKANRYKIRVRNYLNTESAFLEIKNKNNKGKTLKNRLTIPFGIEISKSKDVQDFIKSSSPYCIENIYPNITTSYDRITLVDFNNQLRMTIDTNLQVSTKHENRTIKNLCIVEIKKPTHETNELEQIIKEIGIQKFSISKYCMAINLLTNKKMNRFKSKIRNLEKLLA
jgi:hypothetical protein